jgi:hypothetical protein
MSVYLTELLNSGHNKKDFTCGKSALDNYLHFQANQDSAKIHHKTRPVDPIYYQNLQILQVLIIKRIFAA